MCLSNILNGIILYFYYTKRANKIKGYRTFFIKLKVRIKERFNIIQKY